MIRDIRRFQESCYDLLVIGGGINGAAISQLAAKRKMRVALLEKGDFASGTSSRSTKLIHGGIRYLENLEFDLVYESLKERALQLQVASHLVKPLPFVIPVYQGDRRPLWMMKFGVFLYDLIAGSDKIQKHKGLSAQEVLAMEPGIQKEGLTGGVIYYDAQMDDARLCLENVLMADAYGAHVANYVKVLSFIKENNRVVGVRARDLLMGKHFDVRAKKIVCAVGPWTNELLRLDAHQAKKKVRTTKGIHIVYKGQVSSHALLISSRSDQRIFFVIPWMGNSLIGTTDTDYIGNPDDVRVEQQDVEYLMREARRVFPGLKLENERILTTFAGLRPLIRKGGSPRKVSRKHLFYEAPSGLIFVVGGKYTTYRKVAEDCMNKIRKAFGKEDFKIYGSGPIRESAEAVAKHYGMDKETIRSLMSFYGSRYQDVLKLVEKDPALKEKISEQPLVIKAQLVYSVQTEMAQNEEDVLWRRLSLIFHAPISEKILAEVRSVLTQKK